MPRSMMLCAECYDIAADVRLSVCPHFRFPIKSRKPCPEKFVSIIDFNMRNILKTVPDS